MDTLSSEGIAIPPSNKERLMTSWTREIPSIDACNNEAEHPRARNGVKCRAIPSCRQSNQPEEKQHRKEDRDNAGYISKNEKPNDISTLSPIAPLLGITWLSVHLPALLTQFRRRCRPSASADRQAPAIAFSMAESAAP